MRVIGRRMGGAHNDASIPKRPDHATDHANESHDYSFSGPWRRRRRAALRCEDGKAPARAEMLGYPAAGGGRPRDHICVRRGIRRSGAMPHGCTSAECVRLPHAPPARGLQHIRRAAASPTRQRRRNSTSASGRPWQRRVSAVSAAGTAQARGAVVRARQCKARYRAIATSRAGARSSRPAGTGPGSNAARCRRSDRPGGQGTR